MLVILLIISQLVAMLVVSLPRFSVKINDCKRISEESQSQMDCVILLERKPPIMSEIKI